MLKSTANALGGQYRNIYQIRRKPIRFACIQSPCIPGREGVVDFVDFSIHRKNWGIEKSKIVRVAVRIPNLLCIRPQLEILGLPPFFGAPYVKLFQGLDFGAVRVRCTVRYPVPTATAHANISSMLRAQSIQYFYCILPVLVHFN